MEYIKKFFGHLKTVIVHKWWVFYYCYHFGIPFRGLVHDLSKFHPTEFFESVKYYSGDRSPIDNCKDVNGMSMAWMHHKGRNKHHYEYWQDSFDAGGRPLIMPFKDSLEQLCDYLGAGRSYDKHSFSFYNEWRWWQNKQEYPLAMHPVNKQFITSMLTKLKAETMPNYWRRPSYWKDIAYETYFDILRDYNTQNTERKELSFRDFGTQLSDDLKLFEDEVN